VHLVEQQHDVPPVLSGLWYANCSADYLVVAMPPSTGITAPVR